MGEKVRVATKTLDAKTENSSSQAKKANLSKPVSSPTDHILFLQRTVGNRAVERLLKSGIIQAKLTIGEPGDIYEREADRVAEQIMRMPELSKAQRKRVSEYYESPSIQRVCTECEEEVHRQKQNSELGRLELGHSSQEELQRQPMEEEEEEVLQTKKASSQLPEVTSDLESQINGIKSGGYPLLKPIRDFFEPRFDYDFSQVRVYTDSKAAESARAVNALAYTVGQDIVFGAGQYTPDTPVGQQLLAHELTHVVQQRSGGINPMIQRRLLVTGNQMDIKAFLGLLEPASGLTLKHNPKTKEVSITASVLKPPSSVLASRLWTIIDDPKQDAEINLGRKGEGVLFGKFPSTSEDLIDNPVQEIRIDQILALEKGSPGSGVSKLGHEIVENYEGHAPRMRDLSWSDVFKESHGKATEVEDLITRELVGPGRRRNTFFVPLGTAASPFLRYVQDVEKYFLVWDLSFGKGTVSNARRAPRVKVSTYTIHNFTADSKTVPKSGAKTIAALAADLKKNPTASALVEGFASVKKSPEENVRLAERWAGVVQDEVIDLAADNVTTNWRRFHLEGNAARGRNSVVITLERPDL